MEKIVLTYQGKEALEMLKLYFPKTWREEIMEGQIFIKGLMKVYHLPALESFRKFIKSTNSPYNGIATFAALYLMSFQNANSPQVIRLRGEQLAYGRQLVALESNTVMSFSDKGTLREFYLKKQTDLQERINSILFEFPLLDSEVFAIETRFCR